MKQIFIASSRKFYSEVEQLIQRLKATGTIGLTPMKKKMDTDDESEKLALLKAFSLIDSVDEIYVYAKNGYIGKTVAMEMTYAYANHKKVIASEKIEEPSANAVATAIIDIESYIKSEI